MDFEKTYIIGENYINGRRLSQWNIILNECPTAMGI